MSIQKSSGKWIHGPITINGHRLLGISPSVLGYADEKDEGAVFLYGGHYYVQENGKAWLETDIDDDTAKMLETTSKMQAELDHYLWVPIDSDWKCQGKRKLVFTSMVIRESEVKNCDDWRLSLITIRRLDDGERTLSVRGDILSNFSCAFDGEKEATLISVPARLMGNREIAFHPRPNKIDKEVAIVATTEVEVMRHSTNDRCFIYHEGDSMKIVAWGNRDVTDLLRTISEVVEPSSRTAPLNFSEWKTRCWFDQTDVQLLTYFVPK
jgi:hypothetical protein